MPQDYEELVGSRLVIGFPGTGVTPDVVEQFRASHAGGVIFFRINFSSPEQIRRKLYFGVALVLALLSLYAGLFGWAVTRYLLAGMAAIRRAVVSAQQ